MLKRSLRHGFTLLEMMVVILIIGILSTFLVVNVPDWIDSAKITANQNNMKRIYSYMLMYQSQHNGGWPRDEGQRFFLRLWKDKVCEHTESNAKMFFSPVDVMDYPAPPFEEMSLEEYLDQWDEIGPGFTSYAGFDSGGDMEVRRDLRNDPGHTTIVADAILNHRNSVVYLTADGVTHELLLSDIEDEYGLELHRGDFLNPGPGCEIEELRTVTND